MTHPVASNCGLGWCRLPVKLSLARWRAVGVRGPELGRGGSWKIWSLSLTCTHSYCVPRAVPTVIAVEAPVWVTDGSLCAVVPELLGTYLTAFTAICDKADAQGAARWGLWALTWPLAELRACRRVLQWHWGESHGCGGWRDDLWRKGRGEKGVVESRLPKPKWLQLPFHLHCV